MKKTIEWCIENYDYNSLEVYVEGRLYPFITNKSLNPLVGNNRHLLKKEVEDVLYNEDCKYLRIYIDRVWEIK